MKRLVADSGLNGGEGGEGVGKGGSGDAGGFDQQALQLEQLRVVQAHLVVHGVWRCSRPWHHVSQRPSS